MVRNFFEHPIINSPYEYPSMHWELDNDGQPTNKIIDRRRRAEFVTPVPKPKGRKSKKSATVEIEFGDQTGVSTKSQKYDPTPIINDLRVQVNNWRNLKNPRDWQVTPETKILLQHWRHHEFGQTRPFFCQLEAIETLIWLTEVAPKFKETGKTFVEHLMVSNQNANPGLDRLALKLATGAGKTTVMAMIIAWQTINAVRYPKRKNFTCGFLVVAPGLTIRDRLRVLLPNDPDSYYKTRELVPVSLLPELNKSKIVITNFHAFKRREKLEISKVARRLLQGRLKDEVRSLETNGQMLRRVMPNLIGMRGNVMVLNDEAHHCYHEKPRDLEGDDEGILIGDERFEAQKNQDVARIWISGLEIVNQYIGIQRIVDLSATPFFLRGSGYAEGTLFPWTMSDFSLMDAIECGIVKLPRVPVTDNIPGSEMPRFRNLWEHIGKNMPKRGRTNAGTLNPLSLPNELQTALQALYGHYEKTFSLWKEAKKQVPPCFIIVCNNTASSKLIYDYISGFHYLKNDGASEFEQGRLALFRNFDDNGQPLSRPNTLLIDSRQLESGESLDKNFRDIAKDEIKRFRREIIERTGDKSKAENLTDEDLLREVMNTVGKPGQLGGLIRCVVSVSMLTEGWDANSVTHILGVRAFGTQLLCEQVVGRALRRQSYELNEDGYYNVEYADVFGIPFDFTAKPAVVSPGPEREIIRVHAISPERDACEIRFPRIAGYRVELPNDRLEAKYNDDSTLVLKPQMVGPSSTRNQGIIGEGVNMSLIHTGNLRQNALVYYLAKRLLETKWRDQAGEPKFHLFGQLKRVTQQWLESHLVCVDGTYPAQLMYQTLADTACDRITRGVVAKSGHERQIKVIFDPYNPDGNTRHVNFSTSKELRWKTDENKCHINWAICDSTWEMEFCRIVEKHRRVRAYVRNDNLGFEVPYYYRSESRIYLPDFIVLVDDDRGNDDLLQLVVEIKGFRGENAKEKKATMDTYWVPGVNQLGNYGRWAFVEFRDIYGMEAEFDILLDEFSRLIEREITGIR